MCTHYREKAKTTEFFFSKNIIIIIYFFFVIANHHRTWKTKIILEYFSFSLLWSFIAIQLFINVYI